MILKFLLISLMLLSSCANYINSIHRQLDIADKKTVSSKERSLDPYKMYRDRSRLRSGDRRPIKDPITFTHQNTGTAQNVAPQSNAHYPAQRPRYKSSDFEDNRNSESLWTDPNGESNFLFTNNDKKRVGDIIVLEVAKDFKDEISNELKRAFPVVAAPVKKDPKAAADSKEADKTAPPTPDAKDGEDSSDKIYDKISTQIIEEISGDYILVRGLKEIIFRQKKRFLEIQALISRKDVFDGDKIVSDKALEKKIIILR